MVCKRCVVPGCKSIGPRMVSFPRREKLVSQEWVNRIKSPKFEGKSLEDICSMYRVCLNHFRDECMDKSNSRRYLLPYALPSIDLPGSDSSVTLSSFLTPKTLAKVEGKDCVAVLTQKSPEPQNCEVVLMEKVPSTIELVADQLIMERNDHKVSTNEETELNVDQFDRLCRTCLSKDESFLTPISQVFYEDKTIPEIIQICASVEVRETDRLPQGICSVCLDALIKTYSFICKCRKADSSLKSTANKANSVTTSDSQKENVDEPKKKNVKRPRRKIQKAVTRKSFKCNSCQETFHTFVQFRRHRKETKHSGRRFKCIACQDSFETFEELKMHRQETNHSRSRYHKCDVCGKDFLGYRLRVHMRTHTKEQPFKCEMCPRAFSLKANLKRHTMGHTNEKRFMCEDCGKVYTRAISLQLHRENHSEQVIADRIEKRERKRCIRNRIVNHPGYDYVCEVCGRCCRTMNRLKLHRLIHGEKRFLCNYCGKAFTKGASLKLHLRLHTGEKPYGCVVCEKSFAYEASLVAHMTVHTGEKPYGCGVCQRTFAYENSLIVHMRIHTGEKPFRCPVCPISFSQVGHRKSHMQTHSGERPHVCSYCGKSFAFKGNLTVHTRIHTEETPYVCPVCGKGFRDSSSMKRHRRGHGEIVLLDSTYPTDVEIAVSEIVIE